MAANFVFGAMVYVVAVSICYVPAVKDGPFFFPIGLICGLLANYLWLSIARQSDQSSTLLHSLYWDAMLTAMYAVIPILFFNVRVTGNQLVGLLLILAGIAFSKL
jgi:multidrug transporter EmrE-like cation transporter